MRDDGLDTLVAGVRCREVLDDLSAYLDGELTAARVSQLQGHLGGCNRCARFGGHVVRLLADLREGLHTPTPLTHEAACASSRTSGRCAARVGELCHWSRDAYSELDLTIARNRERDSRRTRA